MRLLLDQNLSHKLVARIADLFAGSTHVRELGLNAASDDAIWTFAGGRGFTILSKDGDFHQMSMLRGAPPKVVWLRIGNASTETAERLIRARADALKAFVVGEGALLIVDP